MLDINIYVFNCKKINDPVCNGATGSFVIYACTLDEAWGIFNRKYSINYNVISVDAGFNRLPGSYKLTEEDKAPRVIG